MRAQEGVHRQLGLLMPLLAVRSASMGLAGTDVFHHEHFVRAAEEHRRLIQRTLNGDIATNGRFGQTYIAGPELWASIPTFTYAPPDLAPIVSNQSSSFVWLLVWFGVAGAAFVVGLRRVAPE
jgi:ABC-2 type transport system permease protein